MGLTPASAHMLHAFQELFAENSTPFASRTPSGGVMLRTQEPDPFGNFVIGASLDELPAAMDHLADGTSISFVLEVGDRKPELEAIVEPAGYSHALTMPAMSVDLDALPTPALPDGYEFGRFTSSDDAAAWSGVLANGYPVAPLASAAMSPLHVPASDAPDATIQFFLVSVEGQPVGVSALVLSQGIAGVYCVATLPEHRRKGIGACLTALPLLRAKELGYKVGVLQASSDGYPVYTKLGFKDDGVVQGYLRMLSSD